MLKAAPTTPTARAGDELLKAVATELDDLRGTDTVARHGADEFAVLLPGTSAEAARKVAATLAEAIAATGVDDGTRVSVTASAGIAAIDADAPGGEAILREADRAMHAARHARTRLGVGRGCGGGR